jgi:tetratricopeptide (TPR) repeat protein
MFFICCLSLLAEEKLSPADLEKIMKKGTMAAEQGSWTIALKYFNEVLRADPNYYPAYFNMGLAHARAGNELAALAWFNAYLHFVPQAEDRAQVEDEIARLEVALEAKMEKIVTQAEEAALALPEKGHVVEEGEEPYDIEPRADAIRGVCYWLGNIGDMALAERFIGKHYPDKKFDELDTVKKNYALALAEADDCEGALKIAGQLTGEKKNDVLWAAAKGMYRKNDFDGAVTLLLNTDGIGVSTDIIKDLGLAGRVDDAVAIYGKSKLGTRIEILPVLAAALADAGRGKEASEFIKKDEALVETRLDYILFEQLLRVTQAYLAAGDMENARRVAQTLKPVEGNDLDHIWRELALVYYRVGDEGKAQEAAGRIKEEKYRNYLADDEFLASRDTADPAVLEKMLPRIGLSKEKDFNYSFIPAQYGHAAWRYLAKGDTDGFARVEGALKSRKQEEKLLGDTAWFYGALADLALSGRDQQAADYVAKRYGTWLDDDRKIKLKAQEQLKAKRPVEALKTLLSVRARWSEILLESWFWDCAEKAVKAARLSGDGAAARSFADTAAEYTKGKDGDRYCAAAVFLYEAAGDAQLSSFYRNGMQDRSWIDLARSFETGDTADPAAYFEKNKDTDPQDMPGKIAYLGALYGNGLRKIGLKAKKAK